jgi:hypothetical protein
MGAALPPVVPRQVAQRISPQATRQTTRDVPKLGGADGQGWPLALGTDLGEHSRFTPWRSPSAPTYTPSSALVRAKDSKDRSGLRRIARFSRFN